MAGHAASQIDAAVIERASLWMVRLWADDASEADRQACARWRAEHPQHELAWQRLQAFGNKLEAAPREAGRQVLREPAPQAWQARRRALQVFGVLLTAGGAAWLARGSDAWQLAGATHRTGTGQFKDVTLPDGTRVMLSTASAIDIAFDGQQRLIVLRAGEILVTSAPDPAPRHRPLRVQGQHGRVQALGTRFSVRQDEQASRVAVFDGAVEVRALHGAGAAVRLEAGQGASYDALQVSAPVRVPATAAAWSQGVLVADNLRLDALLLELARYRPGLLRCDPAVAGLRVNGVFSVRDTDRALHNLTRALPVDVAWRTRYWVTVSAAAAK